MVALNVTPQNRSVHTGGSHVRAVPFSALLIACLFAGPAWADTAPAAPAPAPEAPKLQIICLAPMAPFADNATAILKAVGALPAFEADMGGKAVMTFFLAPGGKGWAQTVTDLTTGNSCLTGFGPSWKETAIVPASPRPRVKRPPTIRPIDPVVY